MIKEWLKRRSNRRRDKICAMRYFELLYKDLNSLLKENGLRVFLSDFDVEYEKSIKITNGSQIIIEKIISNLNGANVDLEMFSINSGHDVRISFLKSFFATFLPTMSLILGNISLEIPHRQANQIRRRVAEIGARLKEINDFDKGILLVRLEEIFNENKNKFGEDQKELFKDIILLIGQ